MENINDEKTINNNTNEEIINKIIELIKNNVLNIEEKKKIKMAIREINNKLYLKNYYKEHYKKNYKKKEKKKEENLTYNIKEYKKNYYLKKKENNKKCLLC